MQVGRSNNTTKEVVMLTSIRGLPAASLSAGLLLVGAPAFASTQVSRSEAETLQPIDADLIAASMALDELPTGPVARSPDRLPDRASAPMSDEASPLAGDSGLTFSANTALTTQYRFRGVDLSGGEIAIQGGFDAAHSSGFYVGTWASSLDETTVGYGAVELDLYGGWTGAVAEGLTADVGFIAYTYPDAPAGDFDYYEIYGSLGFSLGPAATTVGVAYDPEQDGLDFGGLTRDNLYLYTDFSVAISSTPITLNAHLGYTDGSLTFTDDSKSFDWLLGATWALNGNFSASVAYIDAEEDIATGQFNPTRSAIVGTLSATF
jgi:uncharacterized protein (TIGR02001 family)